MTKLVSLNNDIHSGLRIRTDLIDAESAHANVIPLSISECVHAATTLPIVFIKNIETGQFSLMGMTGFERGENLFLLYGEWDGLYSPLNVRRQPFFAGLNENDSNQKDSVLCINLESQSLSKVEGVQIFNEEGQLSDIAKSKSELVFRLLAELPRTEKFALMMLEFDLLAPVSLDIEFANGESTKATGIYSIDEQKLQSLDTQQIELLHKEGFLPAVYAMQVSLGHVSSLIDRRNKFDSLSDDVPASS